MSEKVVLELGRWACVICAAATVLAAPQVAAAKPGYYVSEPSPFEFVQLRASGGFHFTLTTIDQRRLFLLANRFQGGANQSASYTVPRAASTGNDIRASLGRLGRVALRFRPVGPARAMREPGNGCEGRDATIQNGVFEGVLRFRGEHGFTSVDATSAKGQVLRSFRQVCKRPHEPRRGGGSGQRGAVGLSVYVADHPTRPSFSVYRERPSPRFGPFGVSLAASVSERRGRIAISRSVFVSAEASAFAVRAPGASPVTATLAPPFPFAGTARFERHPDGNASWSGNLSVEMPGRGPVPLTGPAYTAELCRNSGCSCLPANGCVTFGSVKTTVTGADRRLQRLRSRFGL